MQTKKTNSVLGTVLAISCCTLFHAAFAEELLDALGDDELARFAELTALASSTVLKTDALDVLRERARKTEADRGAADTPARRALAIEPAGTPVMLETMIELEALPFVKVSGKDSHRVYFGISFDGVLGLHGNF